VARAPDFGMAETFDLWFSHIVLQHNPPPVIANVLRRMFSMLAPGGVAIFQVPTYSPGYRFNAEVYLAEPRQKNIEMHCLPQPVVFKLAAQAGCIPLEVREDLAMGYPWISNIFVFRKS
jgi:SAM-dependent methyltransferase